MKISLPIVLAALICTTGGYADEAPKIEELKAKRIQVLETIVEHHLMRYREGITTLNELLQPQIELTEARLSAEKEPGRRVEILKEGIKQVTAIEEYSRARFEVGAAMESDALQASAARLKFEIMLLEAEAGK